MNAIVNQGQERAAWAWQAIEEAVRELGGKKAESYGLLVKKLPSWLQVSGLGQTMAFLFSKSKNGPYGLLFAQLSRRIGTLVGAKNRAEGMKLITELSPSDYRRVTYELMRTAELLKRFADGRIDTESAELSTGT
jgi:CRISPR-associated protein Cmr5